MKSLRSWLMLFALLATTPGVAQPLYRIDDLGVVGRWSSAGAINDGGLAAFITHRQEKDGVELPWAAYLGDRGAISPLALHSTGDQYITDINNGGIAVGTSQDPTGGTHSAVRYVNGVAEPLAIGCCGQTFAEGINSVGQIIGSIIEDGRSRTFVYANEQVQLIGDATGPNNRGADINDQGSIVGAIDRGAPPVGEFGDVTPYEAYLYKDEVITQLGTLGGHSSVAAAINETNSVVGSSLNEAGKWKAFQYDEGLGMRELAMPGVESHAYDINEAGTVVGMAFLETYQPEAVLYDPMDGARFLKDLIVSPARWSRLSAAVSINKRGQILGNGYINHEIHVFLATPIPEPAAILLATLATTALVSLARRRF
jgi:uncharacterized membrane protein